MRETCAIKAETCECIEKERRGKQRFRIELGVRCRLVDRKNAGRTCLGQTINISSSGLLISTQTPLSFGERVVLSIRWPALINEICPVNLLMYGSVVRSTESEAAIAVDRNEFRTRGTEVAPLNPALTRNPDGLSGAAFSARRPSGFDAKAQDYGPSYLSYLAGAHRLASRRARLLGDPWQ